MALLQPQISSYTKASRKVWFTYVDDVDRFQHGLLGINDSYVAGNLYLQFPEEEPLKAKRIEISITGIENVYWTEQKSRSVHRNGTWETEKHTEHYRHKEEILNQSLLLWESETLKTNIKSKKEFYEKITNMNFPFRLPLPNDLPPSMNLGIGSICYRVNAKIKRKRNFWKCQGSKKLVTCECYIIRYSPMPKPAPIRWNEWDDSTAWKRGLGYDISMIYDTYGPMNPIIVKLALKFLNQNLSVKEVFVGLKEYYMFSAEGKNNFSKKYVHVKSILGSQIQKNLNDHNEWSHNLKIEVNQANWAIDRYNIKLYHKIKVKVKFAAFSGRKNINLERMVDIKNIYN